MAELVREEERHGGAVEQLRAHVDRPERQARALVGAVRQGVLVEVGHRGELENALTQIPQGHARAVVLLPGMFVFANRVQIAERAAKSQLPYWVGSGNWPRA